MDFSCIDIRELLDSTLSKWFENPGDKSPNLEDLGIQLDCNDTTKDTSKDTKERFVEPSVIPQVYVNEYNEDIDPTWTNMENAKWASKKEADLVGETDQEGDVFMYNYRSDQEEPKKDFFTDEIYPSGIEPRFYMKAEEEPSQTSVVNSVVDNVKDSVSENVTPQVGGTAGTPRMYGAKPSGDKQMKNYAGMTNNFKKEAEEKSLEDLQAESIQLHNEYEKLYKKLVDEEAAGMAEQYAEEYISNIKNKLNSANTLSDLAHALSTDEDSVLDIYEDRFGGKRTDDISSITLAFINDEDWFNDEYDYQYKDKLDSSYRDAEYKVDNNKDDYPELKDIFDKMCKVDDELESIELKPYDDLEDKVREIAKEYGFSVGHTIYSQSSNSRYLPLFKDNTYYKVRISNHEDVSMFGPRDSDIILRVDGSTEDDLFELEQLLQKSASLFTVTTIDKIADLFGDGVRQDEIPDSENKFLNRSPITEVNKDQKDELMEKAKKVNKPVTYIPKDLNFPFIEDEMAGNKLFYTDTDFLLDDLYQ